MKSPIIVILAALLAVGATAATTTADFRYQAPLNGKFPGDYLPAKVTLSADVISRTHNDCSDLRIFDQQGTEVPYVLYPEIMRAEYRRNTVLEILKYEDLDKGSARLTLKVPKDWNSSEGVIIDTSNHDFEKNVKVETSRDGSSWKSQANGQIFDYSSRVNLHNNAIDIPKTDARFLRLTISDSKPGAVETEQISLQYKDLRIRSIARDGQPFRIDEVSAWQGKTEEEKRVFDQVKLAISNQSVDSNGDLVIDLAANNLPFAQLEFDIATKYFYRATELQQCDDRKADRWYTVSHDAIYRLPGNDKPRLKISLPGEQHPNQRLIIHNGDNSPLTIHSITGSYTRQNLYFLPKENQAYRLYFDSSRVRAANYDIASVLSPDAELLGKAAIWQIGDSSANNGYKRDFLSDTETNGLAGKIFKGLIIIMVLALGFWAWTALKKLK